ncbi:phenylalanine--tRNA ligase subunit alpha [Candidatus Dojkabacteria bacterium]|uniref:Phenylalanine--tRNA ligase alpha subunit n=1 Tax=Candidatus Dojkabacteria bacterium TaxID=2099670 RepID=A0A5C7J3D5_9BACT|nr:MAG: phenylalanine--tRNA ligase subunit alpha [Candidatus Dojkabacteria bacterium]
MTSLPDQIGTLRNAFLAELKEVTLSEDLENLKTKYLGKKGPIQALMISLKDCSSEERPHLGKLINDLKTELLGHVDHSLQRLKNQELEIRLQKETIDPTLPGRRPNLGRIHPIQQMMDEIVEILTHMGFSIGLGPQVETDYYNFEGLNFAPDHPARDTQDTFYLGTDLLLRTHTTTVQVHALRDHKPPLRMIAPGRVFRNEDISARSHVFFHQVDGFAVDKGITFADLLSMMEEFMNKLFGEKIETRFRPSYFPFVEPGLEVDVRCTACKGSGCKLCKHTGWLEILGAGMIHPNVLRKANIDPDEYSGYAWGMGVERPLLLRSGITDIRFLTQNDQRFLGQFP